MQDLAASDENRARLLKELKSFFQLHDLKAINTAIVYHWLNGGKAPLILKDDLSPTQLPEQFQKVSVDDTLKIREALEAGDHPSRTLDNVSKVCAK